MRYSKLLLILMMILSWFTVPFVGRASIKRFLPAALFMAIIVRMVNFIAKKRRWWWWYVKVHPSVSGSFPFVCGSFFVGSLWILKFTYGNFMKYMGLNLAVDSIFTYVIEPYLQKFGIASLVRMKKIQLMYVFTVLAFLLYGFQLVKEKVSLKKATYENN
ncbi:hypothetical protein [Cytobacillus praedii]|uniref:Uncharacterized protein n=1 Tax=Cytobacillus praedii TaxID=1742358 RepID=A0A4R1ALB6_9BACI|nr:hypothetical protein [Cytobacillus praedii]TCJ00466.1 hypothetical protein E0Y62_26760 [Cytobacillus praedii]